jgi:transposase
MTEDSARPGRIDRDALREMHARSMSLAAMAAHFGVTRERVRQVVKELGLKSRLEMIKERNNAILHDAASDTATDEELAEKYGISLAMVGLIRRQNGFSATEYRKERLAEAVKRVREGVSIRAAAHEFSVSPGTLTQHLDEEGVKSRHGRWGALAHRETMIPKMRAQGKGWDEILHTLSEYEKRTIRYETLRIWMRLHLPTIDMPETTQPSGPSEHAD